MLQEHSFQNKNNRGFVALMSVLIISAVGVIITLSLLTIGTSYMRSSFALGEGYKARALAEACANVALENIRLDSEYQGNETINFEDDSCGVLLIGEIGGIYTINTYGVVGSFLRRIKVLAARTEDVETMEVSLTIQSWQEMADF